MKNWTVKILTLIIGLSMMATPVATLAVEGAGGKVDPQLWGKGGQTISAADLDEAEYIVDEEMAATAPKNECDKELDPQVPEERARKGFFRAHKTLLGVGFPAAVALMAVAMVASEYANNEGIELNMDGLLVQISTKQSDKAAVADGVDGNGDLTYELTIPDLEKGNEQSDAAVDSAPAQKQSLFAAAEARTNEAIGRLDPNNEENFYEEPARKTSEQLAAEVAKWKAGGESGPVTKVQLGPPPEERTPLHTRLLKEYTIADDPAPEAVVEEPVVKTPVKPKVEAVEAPKAELAMKEPVKKEPAEQKPAEQKVAKQQQVEQQQAKQQQAEQQPQQVAAVQEEAGNSKEDAQAQETVAKEAAASISTNLLNGLEEQFSYPAAQKKAGKGGTVTVGFKVKEDGSVTKVRVVSSTGVLKYFSKRTGKLVELENPKKGYSDLENDAKATLTRAIESLKNDPETLAKLKQLGKADPGHEFQRTIYYNLVTQKEFEQGGGSDKLASNDDKQGGSPALQKRRFTVEE